MADRLIQTDLKFLKIMCHYYYYLYSLFDYGSFGQRFFLKDQECFPSLLLKLASEWKSICCLPPTAHVCTHFCPLPVADVHMGEFLS